MKILSLLEYDQSKTLAIFKNKLANIAQEREKLSPEQALSKIENLDPSKNKQYVPWLVKRYIEKEFRTEDSRIRDALINFENLKSRLPKDQRDIGKYTIHSLETLVDSIMNPELGKKQAFDFNRDIPEDAEVLYNGPLGLLVVPKTKEASCALGNGTKWCTAAREFNAFNIYSDAPLYIWIDKSGEKYQFYFGDKGIQFMDSQDKKIDHEKLTYFRTKHPVLSKFFKKKEKEIIDSPSRAAQYAKDILKCRWPEAEPYIMKDLGYAYSYAIDIIKGRWPEAEPYIIKDAWSAANYAVEVIKGRWPEAESIIMKDASSACNYAIYIIKGRWPEAESIIMKDAWSAAFYAKHLLNSRWPEAEPYIMKDAKSAYFYARDIIKGRWPEAEPVIMKHAKSAYLYAKDIIRSRWPEAEPVIMKDDNIKKQYEKFFNIKL